MDGKGNLKISLGGFKNDLKCASMTGKIRSKVISMCIAPMKMKHGDDEDMITTNAMFNNCSRVLLFMITWPRNLESME